MKPSDRFERWLTAVGIIMLTICAVLIVLTLF